MRGGCVAGRVSGGASWSVSGGRWGGGVVVSWLAVGACGFKGFKGGPA